MASPEQERMDAISGALARVLERQNRMDMRLARIESAVGLTETQPLETPVTPPPLPAVPLTVTESAPPPMPAPEPSMETRFGLGWLNRVAVITLLFGVGFFFKYAVDNQWIGPGMRVALGTAAATFALFLGEWMALRGQRIFAQGLTGLGLALLYLSFYASFGFYHLLPLGVAFLLMFLTTAAAAALALHYNAQAVAILGLVGGFLTPALLATGENRMWALAGYTFLLNLGALAIARIRRWPALEYLALAATWLLFLGWSSDWLSNDTRAGAFVWLTLTFALFFTASVASANLWLLALNSGLYFAGSYFLLEPQYRGALGAFAATLALLHGGLGTWTWNRSTLFSRLAAAIGVVLLTLAIPLQFASFRITMLWSLEAAVLAWLAKRYGRARFQIAAWLLFAAVFFRLFVSDTRHFESTLFNARLLTFAIAAASLWAAARFAASTESKVVAYGAGHLALLWGLALEVAGWAERTADPRDVANVTSTGISILMAIYALALIVAGVARGGAALSAVNRIVGLGLMALVIVKLYLVDVWQLSRGFRITAFLALGGLLLLVSYLYSRFKPAVERLWRDQPAPESPPA